MSLLVSTLTSLFCQASRSFCRTHTLLLTLLRQARKVYATMILSPKRQDFVRNRRELRITFLQEDARKRLELRTWFSLLNHQHRKIYLNNHTNIHPNIKVPERNKWKRCVLSPACLWDPVCPPQPLQKEGYSGCGAFWLPCRVRSAQGSGWRGWD